MKAPGCNKPVKFSTIDSGNTFGAICWTDGKREAPMLPDEPWLRKSPSEGVIFWTNECEEIGQINLCSYDEVNPEWEDLEFAEEPTETDYLHATRNGTGDTKERMRYIRMRLWWRGNDRIRRKECTQLPQEHLENLAELVSLLSEDDAYQKLMKAEVLRELSRFDEAQRLLESDFPDNCQDAVHRILELTTSNNNHVATI